MTLNGCKLQHGLIFNSCCCFLFICCNPKLGAEGTRPLQHKVCDTFSVSKYVSQNN